LTKGWIVAGDTPFDEYETMVQKYGESKARCILSRMLKNYKRLALINTGRYEIEHYRQHSQKIADRFNLRYEEIPGSNTLVKKCCSAPGIVTSWSFLREKP